MPSFNPLANVTGRHACTLFDIRLENDFIVFRGNEHESSGQYLKGVVVLCLPGPLKVEDVHLRLLGTSRFNWTDSRVTPTGISNQKVDRTNVIFNHLWDPFVGGVATGSSRSIVLEKGNYEWPFELLLPGDTCESIEGMHEASITYHLKATVARGKLAYDLHTKKRLRIIRTLESSALEFLHAMSVENIWPNKVEYSIVIPQKAVVFGSSIPLETRFTPLLKGLEIGDITCRLIEVHEITLRGPQGQSIREHKREKEVISWKRSMNRDDHWNDFIEDSGQEGWVMNTMLDLPNKLGRCMQDTNVQGIKIRHKLKMVVALLNPDGHVSELRATLPVTIFISPNMPLDEEGALINQTPHETVQTQPVRNIAPPGYGEHILDQLYECVDMNGTHTSGMQTPAIHSGANTPGFYALSRAGSTEDLHSMMGMPVPPHALSSRLADVSLNAASRNQSYQSLYGASHSGNPSGAHTPNSQPHSTPSSPPQSAPLTRQNSAENSPVHLEMELDDLSRVPSYTTAVKSRPLSTLADELPGYFSVVLSAPSSPPPGTLTNPMDTIPESAGPLTSGEVRPRPRPPPPQRRQTSLGFSNLFHHHRGEGPEEELRRRRNQMHSRPY